MKNTTVTSSFKLNNNQYKKMYDPDVIIESLNIYIIERVRGKNKLCLNGVYLVYILAIPEMSKYA